MTQTGSNVPARRKLLILHKQLGIGSLAKLSHSLSVQRCAAFCAFTRNVMHWEPLTPCMPCISSEQGMLVGLFVRALARLRSGIPPRFPGNRVWTALSDECQQTGVEYGVVAVRVVVVQYCMFMYSSIFQLNIAQPCQQRAQVQTILQGSCADVVPLCANQLMDIFAVKEISSRQWSALRSIKTSAATSLSLHMQFRIPCAWFCK